MPPVHMGHANAVLRAGVHDVGRRALVDEPPPEHRAAVPHADEVDVEDPADVLLEGIDQLGAAGHDAGVVDDDVDVPEYRPGLVGQRFD